MTTSLTHQEFSELRQQEAYQREIIHNAKGFDYIESIEDRFSKEHYRAVQLRPELRLEVIDDQYYRDLSLQVDHDDYNLLISKKDACLQPVR